MLLNTLMLLGTKLVTMVPTIMQAISSDTLKVLDSAAVISIAANETNTPQC